MFDIFFYWSQYLISLTLPDILILFYIISSTWLTPALIFKIALIFGLLFTITIVLSGIPHYPGSMPMGATCSAVISAACHQPLPGDREAYRFGVQWGAVSQPSVEKETASETGSKPDHIAGSATAGTIEARQREKLDFVDRVKPGHCCFTTTRDVELPRADDLYQ